MSRFIGKSWADIVEEEERGENTTSWADVVWRGSYIVDESEYEAQVINEVEQEAQVRKYATYADALIVNLQINEQSEYEYQEEVITNNPGDPIGIRAVQSILMSATQMSLSHFHTAGMDNVVTGRVVPSAADAMNSTYSANNTSMTFSSTDDVYALRRQLVGASLMTFVKTVKSDITGLPDRENIWYDALGKKMYEGSILRIYINYNRMRNHGLTLKELAHLAFGGEKTNVSPDFMGIIDLEVLDLYFSQWLEIMDYNICGSCDIKSCNVINGNLAITQGSNILAVSKIPSVDRTTINSNDVAEVEEHYGIEAAASVLALLTGSNIVSDFMARTGRVLSFMKNSVEVTNKGLLTSMGFERPRDDIRRTIVSQQKNTYSVYESIITGSEPHNVFELRCQ